MLLCPFCGADRPFTFSPELRCPTCEERLPGDLVLRQRRGWSAAPERRRRLSTAIGVLALAGFIGRSIPPRAIGVPYDPERP